MEKRRCDEVAYNLPVGRTELTVHENRIVWLSRGLKYIHLGGHRRSCRWCELQHLNQPHLGEIPSVNMMSLDEVLTNFDQGGGCWGDITGCSFSVDIQAHMIVKFDIEKWKWGKITDKPACMSRICMYGSMHEHAWLCELFQITAARHLKGMASVPCSCVSGSLWAAAV